MTQAFKTLQNAAGQGSPQSVLWSGQQSLNKLEAKSRAPAGQMDQALPPSSLGKNRTLCGTQCNLSQIKSAKTN